MGYRPRSIQTLRVLDPLIKFPALFWSTGHQVIEVSFTSQRLEHLFWSLKGIQSILKFESLRIKNDLFKLFGTTIKLDQIVFEYGSARLVYILRGSGRRDHVPFLNFLSSHDDRICNPLLIPLQIIEIYWSTTKSYVLITPLFSF